MNYRGITLRYECEVSRLSAALRPSFAQLDADEPTRQWLDDAISRPHGTAALIALAMARKVMSDYDANGLVGAHDMRVLGTDQWRQLAGACGIRLGGRALDVGAGEGQVTDELKPLFDEVVTTELSSAMARRLRSRGYACHEVDLALEPLPSGSADRFDAIALLNVIDRTSLPYRLVERLGSMLMPAGVLFCAVPVPLNPHVHIGPVTVDPEEILPIAKGGWEEGVSALADTFFPACGFDVVGLSRVPYLCRGTKKEPVIALDDAVFVCRKRGRVERV